MKDKNCACKGIRTCLLCDDSKVESFYSENILEYIYCWKCGDKAYIKHQFDNHTCGNANQSEMIQFISIDGIFLQPDVLTEDEEIKLIQSIDSYDWVDSQSGRRKQDFGPKINFKKKKVNFSSFHGLPSIDIKLLDTIKRDRLRNDPNYSRFTSSTLENDSSDSILCNFKTVEICHLEYCPERGSSIDPHFDDFWIWGERLVTLNLNSQTVLTLTLKPNPEQKVLNYCVRIPLPPRSLLVLYGDSRNRYEHSIRPLDIIDRRLAITYRELPSSFLCTSHDDYNRIGKEFIMRSENLI